jgi:hypothetical protein
VLAEAFAPVRCPVEVPGAQGGDAQGVHECSGPQMQPFLPGLLEISFRPLAGGVRGSRVGVDNA